MNPCNICGDRILHYPGTCAPCREHRTELAKTQWAPSHKARIAAGNSHLNPTTEVHDHADRFDDEKRTID